MVGKKQHAYIVTMGHNTRKWAKACILSVTDCLQHYENLTHVIVDDWSDDGTWERYQQEDLRGPHQILCRPPQRTGSPLASFMYGLSQVSPEPEDVIFWLDADDWLCDPKAIKIMMDVYARNPITEMAYSQHVWFKGRDIMPTDGISRPIVDRTMVRPDNVRFSHFRSFRHRMLSHVSEEYLRQGDGNYWKTCGDSALFLPMLEAAKKVAYVNKVLYVYNVSTGQNEWTAHTDKVSKNSIRIRSMMPNLNTRGTGTTMFPPVRRFKLDFGRACDIECRGCYYLHQKDKFNLSLEQVQKALDDGRARGNRACDISGGEPTLYKDLPRWIEMAVKTGIAPGIITHGQRLAPMLPTLWDAGLSDILFSVHGGEAAHNWWTQTKDGYAKQKAAIEKCASAGFGFRTNTVLHAGYKTLPAMAVELARVRPYISNFINFNPYYEWADKEKPFQARVSEIAPYLREAIDILTNSGTMVNVRYFPFCTLKGYEKHFVDMSQVMFDPYEWDYGVTPKTVERYNQYGVELAKGTRAYADKCADCAIGGTVCYGINAVYLDTFGDSELQPYEGGRILDRFHFRRHAEPGQLYTFIGHNYEWRFRNCA